MAAKGRWIAIKTRRPKELDAALGLTIIWVGVGALSYPGGGVNGTITSPLFLVLLVLTAGAWWWAWRTIGRRQAAGKSLEELQALSPDAFEEWVAARFRERGYSTKVSGMGGDHGVDLVLEKDGETAVVQCKNYKAWSVGEPLLRDIYGAMHDFGAQKAYLVTTGRLTRAAVEWVRGKPIEVWDGDYVAALSLRQTSREEAQAPASTVNGAIADIESSDSAHDASTATACPRCGSSLVERRNRSTGQPFFGCSNFPNCRYTQSLAN